MKITVKEMKESKCTAMTAAFLGNVDPADIKVRVEVQGKRQLSHERYSSFPATCSLSLQYHLANHSNSSQPQYCSFMGAPTEPS